MTSVWTVSFVTGGISADFVQLKPGFRLWLDLLQQGSIKFQLCLDKICKCMFKIMKNFRGTISQINFKKELFRTHLKQRVPSRLMTASARNGGLIIRPHFTGIIYLLPLPLITLQKGFSKVLPHSILVCGLHATKNQPKNFLSLFIYWFVGQMAIVYQCVTISQMAAHYVNIVILRSVRIVFPRVQSL